MRLLHSVILVGLWLVPREAPGQDCIEQALPSIDRARSRADSLTLAERWLAEPPRGDARCGSLLGGMLMGLTSTPAESEWRERQRAAELVESALRSAPDEARLYLAMANLMYNRQSRVDAVRMIDRALERRDRGTPLRPAEVAFAHHLRGIIHSDAWRDWRSYGQLASSGEGLWRCSKSEAEQTSSFSSSATDHTWLFSINQLCPDEFAENMGKYYRSQTSLGRNELDALEAAFARALEADSTYLPAARALLGEWVYIQEWEKAAGLARALQRRLPDDYRPYLYLGMIEHELGRDSTAAPEFGRAFTRMPDSVLPPFDDVAPLLVPDQLTWLNAQDESTQQMFRAAFWNSLDPLYLTSTNERKVEHYARVVTADLLFTSDALREPGWKSFAGQAWIRYGRPRNIWELQNPSGRAVFWDFGPGPDVSFERGTAYRSYRPTDEAVGYLGRLARTTPQTYTPSALVDTVADLPSQLVRTLGEDGRMEVMVHAEWPEGIPEETDAGLTLLDGLYQPVAQWRGKANDRAGLATKVGGLSPGTYSLTLEVWDRPQRRLHRLRDTVSTLAITDSSFVVSDLLLAKTITPPDGGEVVGRQSLALTPLYGSAITAGDPVGLVWEVYRLKGETDGRVRYHVTLELLDNARQPVLTRILRGIGLSGERRPAARLEFDSNRPLTKGRTAEWLELTGSLGPGDYRLVMRFRDEETGTEVVREARLTVR